MPGDYADHVLLLAYLTLIPQNFGGSGGQCSKAQVNEFMDTVTGFFDNTPWVKAYFAFGAMHDMFNVNPDNQLMGGDGKPNALGRKYIKA